MLKLGALGAPLVVAGLFVAIAACSAAAAGEFASGNPEDGGADSGVGIEPDGTAVADSGNSDGNVDGGPPAPTGVLFVHAAPDVLDMRLCWYTNNDPSSAEVPFPSGAPAPASNYPAIPVGGALAVPDASDFVGTGLTVAVIPAALLGGLEDQGSNVHPCQYWLIGGGRGTLNPRFVNTVNLPDGGIVPGATNVVALAGCPAADPYLVDASASTVLAHCGPGYDPQNGNLRFDVIPLHEVSEAGAGLLAVQAAQLSPALAQLGGDGGAVVVSFGPQGATAPIASLAGESASGPSSAIYLDAGTNPTAYGTLGFGVDIQGSSSGPGHVWMSLEQSLELQSPTMNPAVYYTQGTTYVVAVVGDPTAPSAFAPDAAFDGRGLHVLVLPLP